MENKRIKKITSSHWGAFEAIVENGKLVSTNPFKEDPNPNDIPERKEDSEPKGIYEI